MRVFIVCLALLTSLPAGAYVLYKSPDNADAALHWRTDNVSLVFDDQAPEELVPDVAADECEDSFAVWSQLTCGGVLTPFTFDFVGFTHGRQVGYNEEPSAPNENLIIWIQDGAKWRHGPGVLALTSLTYDTNTGQIVDGDLEMNDAEFFFSLSANDSQVDVKNTIVHEAGHFLGLDHSPIAQSSMFAKAPFGETSKRDLHSDDIAGFCALYGPEGYSPFGKWAKNENSPPNSCSVGLNKAGPLWPIGGVLLLLLVFRWSRGRAVRD